MEGSMMETLCGAIRPQERHDVKIVFANGDTLKTAINGTQQEIMEYYRPGRQFNIGRGEYDLLTGVKSVEFLT